MTADWTISSLTKAIGQRQISPLEITQWCLDRIGRNEHRTFIHVDAEGAIKAAKTLESEAARGALRGPLHGVPLAYKDLFYIEGLPASCGTSKRDYLVADETATAVSRLTAAGAITLGKVNMTELAMSPFGENRCHGNVANPWAPAACAGGSSSGSAAAVAAGFVLGTLGSDTAGSIRLPAAYCCVVGLKPTLGRVSRAGVMPLSWSFDHVGPLARTVRDVALLLGVIAGFDRGDSTSSVRPVDDYLTPLEQKLPKFRIGVPTNYYWNGLAPGTEAAVRSAVEAFAKLGASLVDIELPHQDAINNLSGLITRSEATAVHGAFAHNNPDVLAPAINERLEIGYHISAYDYLQAQRLRARLTREFVRDVFERVDVIIAPVAPDAAPLLNEAMKGETTEILANMVRLTLLTRPANGLGLPAISVPCGFSDKGLPLGFQLMGRPFDECSLLQLAHRYEQSFDWWKKRPS